MISMGTYYTAHILGDKNLFGVFSWAINIPLIIALVFTPTLVAKMHGMCKLNVGSYALATVARALVAVAGYTGTGDVKMMLLFTAIAALGQGPWQGDMNAVIASCSEYTWLTKHKRVDGTMYSCTSLGVKLGGGLGTAITGWLLGPVFGGKGSFYCAAGFLHQYAETYVPRDSLCAGCHHYLYPLPHEGRGGQQ